jgi:hypothetical protein
MPVAGTEMIQGAGAAPAVEQTAAQEVVGVTAKNASDPSLWKEVSDWAKANKPLAAAILQAGGSMLGGIAQGAGMYLTEQQKLENQKRLTEFYRQHVQAGSSGGKGVNLGFAPKKQSGGLVQRFMK